MNLDSIEFPNAAIETSGSLISGKLSFNNRGLVFRNPGTGKNIIVAPADWDDVYWIRMAGKFGLKFFLKSGPMHQFAGFVEEDRDGISRFFKKSYQVDLKDEDKSIKGWNWGSVKFRGKVLEFNVDRQVGFHVPLTYVSQCTTAKNEATLEFHPNEEASVALMEMRFYIPQEGAEEDPLQSFHTNVLDRADIVQATGEALLELMEVPSLTPRGRYELKVYPTFLQLHGKTFDYKITYSSILRIFILPHPDGNQMFFILSLDPPIKQGQTRYPFLILNFKKDEDPVDTDLNIDAKELKEKYDGRLEKHVSGQTYEVLGRVLKGLVNRKITVPGAFKGTAGSSLSCSYKAAVGYLYPLDRGFIFVHKPAIHVRFDEILSVNFARSGGNTRSFDFELETKNGQTHTFNGLGKEEYSKLFDFVSEKKLRVKNRGDKDDGATRKIDVVLDSDDESEHDAYMERVRNEGRERDEDDEEEDEDFKPAEDGSDVAEEFDSDAGGSTDEDDEDDDGDKPKKDKEPPKEKKKKSSQRYNDEVGEEGRKQKRKRKEGKKDPNQPKRPMSAYMIWLNHNRETIKNDNPGISMIDISKKAGELWKQVTDHKKWEEKAAEAKREYDVKMKEYEKTKRTRDDDGASSSKKSASKSSKSASTSSPIKAVKSDEFIATDDDTSSEDEKAAKPAKQSKPAEDSSNSEVELSD